MQTGVLIATTAALSLQKLCLKESNFKYLFPRRLTQDTLENLFSVIRQKNLVPRLLQFKTALRTITLSQFFQPCRTGNIENFYFRSMAACFRKYICLFIEYTSIYVHKLNCHHGAANGGDFPCIAGRGTQRVK